MVSKAFPALRRWGLQVVIATACAAATLGCKSKADGDAPKAEPTKADTKAVEEKKAPPKELVILSGRKESLVGPLLEAFTKETGIRVRVDYNATPVLATRLLTEGAAAEGDVVLAQEVGYLGNLAKAGLLERLGPKPEAAAPNVEEIAAMVKADAAKGPTDAKAQAAASDAPPAAPQPAPRAEAPSDDPGPLLAAVGPVFRDPERFWIGVSGRLRVLVHDPKITPRDEMPRSLQELASIRWAGGKIGWAPGNASMHAHVSVLRHLWGEAETERWLRRVVKLEPKAYPKNSPQVQAAADGAIRLGWVNHYYLHKLGLADKASNHSFPTPNDAGNVMMVSGAGILAAAKDKDGARRLIEFLVGEATQKRIAQQLFEYPARAGVATHPNVPALESIQLATFDPRHIADVGPTLDLLRKVGLQ